MDAPFPDGMMESIAKFFESDHTRKPGKDIYHDVFDTNLFFPLQRQTELAKMMETARTICPSVVMEIGADKGGGLYHWCKCLPTVRRVIACEIRGTPYAAVFEKAFPHIDFLWLAASSYDETVSLKVQRWLRSDVIDCLFIDGDKSTFIKDFDTYLPMMRKDGLVFMHDINDRPPRNAYLQCIARGYRCHEIINVADSIRACKRQHDGIPPANTHEGWLRHWRGLSCGVGVIELGSKT